MSLSAAFEAAIGPLIAREGGYVDNPDDSGGPTKYGISQLSYPGLNIKDLTLDQAADIYKKDYWDRLDLDRLPAAVAAKVFDVAVNMGLTHGVVVLQRALRACGFPVEEDGILGGITARTAAMPIQAVLLAAMRSETAGIYRMIARTNPDEEVFLDGWLRRAYTV